MPAIRGGALALLAFLGHLAGLALTGPAGPTGLTVLSAAVLAAVLTGLVAATVAGSARIARAVTAAPLRGRAAGLREKSWSAAFLRQRDPDAAGRPRPRAPSAAPAA
jgi:Family of unknown function (DUF6412)